MSYITKPDQTDDYYNATQNSIRRFLSTNKFDAIISTIHSVNYVLLRNLKELNLRNLVKYYIVITDPYLPISQGFDVHGANHYFVTTSIVKKHLEKKGISSKDISIVSYPLNDKFLKPITPHHFFSSADPYPTLLINSGSQGIFSYFNLFRKLCSYFDKLHFVFICGKNENLQNALINYIEKNDLRRRAVILGFINNMHEVMKAVDFILTKPGANTLFESISLQKPLIIDGINGFLFQEQGIVDFIKENPIGEIARTEDQLMASISKYIDKTNREKAIESIKKMEFSFSGSEDICDYILKGRGS